MSFEKKSTIPFDRKAKTENFVRPNHNDFATSSELKERKFNGWRENKLISMYELWIMGEVKRTVGFIEAAADPMLLEKAAADYFGLHEPPRGSK